MTRTPEPRTEHVIVVAPHIRPDGTKHPNAFAARLAGTDAVLCVSDTLLLDAARALLKSGLAAPDDMIAMRHAGADIDALRGSVGVGVAAGLVIEDAPSGSLRRRKYREICGDVASSIAQTDGAATPLAGNNENAPAASPPPTCLSHAIGLGIGGRP